jgi:hypothetical protein
MPDQHDLNPDPRAERATDVEKNDPDRGCLWLTSLRILCIHNGVYRDANSSSTDEIGDPRIGDLLRFGDCTSELSKCEEQARAECENGSSHFRDRFR